MFWVWITHFLKSKHLNMYLISLCSSQTTVSFNNSSTPLFKKFQRTLQMSKRQNSLIKQKSFSDCQVFLKLKVNWYLNLKNMLEMVIQHTILESTTSLDHMLKNQNHLKIFTKLMIGKNFLNKKSMKWQRNTIQILQEERSIQLHFLMMRSKSKRLKQCLINSAVIKLLELKNLNKSLKIWT